MYFWESNNSIIRNLSTLLRCDFYRRFTTFYKHSVPLVWPFLRWSLPISSLVSFWSSEFLCTTMEFINIISCHSRLESTLSCLRHDWYEDVGLGLSHRLVIHIQGIVRICTRIFGLYSLPWAWSPASHVSSEVFRHYPIVTFRVLFLVVAYFCFLACFPRFSQGVFWFEFPFAFGAGKVDCRGGVQYLSMNAKPAWCFAPFFAFRALQQFLLGVHVPRIESQMGKVWHPCLVSHSARRFVLCLTADLHSFLSVVRSSRLAGFITASRTSLLQYWGKDRILVLFLGIFGEAST